MTEWNFDEVIDRTEVPALKWHTRVLGPNAPKLFQAGVADMDFQVAPCIREAMTRRLAHGVFGYEAVPDGLFPSLTEWLNDRHNWRVDPEHILRAPNVLNALAMVLNTFTEEGAGVIIQPPVFFDFQDIIHENGRRVVLNPLRLQEGGYEMDFDGLEEVASNSRTQMMFLCNPHNPVGRVWTRAELEQLGQICRRHNVLVVSDELHGDLTFAGHPYVPFASLGEENSLNSIVCLSPAKSFNIASCCAAFTLVTDNHKRAALQAENSRLTVNKNNAFSSVAMEAAYRGGGPWLDAAIAYLTGNRDLLRERISGLERVKLVEPEGTFLAWLDFRGMELDTDRLTAFLREEAGWAITRGIAFGEEGAGFGRLNFACPRSRLDTALERLEAAVVSHS
ncbi:MalY/PatB family protein [Roseibium alexandrii]|uniref:cysteine-S-conjugate beta-lyase n=1 Tax=Roseibium alexandrii (strain DSM 17067 / NCIMB 14079 / DFL-11) TaxID=244592 RepID=A0A5E8GTR9_ROSAD|nr:PatB family C-S lyase [Roseibium alexandrii]EEE43264.1 Bifunctional PLP-dependent protein [Roseibium alexandrii DFL-11]